MTQDGTIVVRFKDMPNDTDVLETLESRCTHLREEFPETDHYEISLSPDAADVTAHGHVSGKHTNVAAQATSPDARRAGERLLDKLERELRRLHDKRIFAARREAQKSQNKRAP